MKPKTQETKWDKSIYRPQWLPDLPRIISGGSKGKMLKQSYSASAGKCEVNGSHFHLILYAVSSHALFSKSVVVAMKLPRCVCDCAQLLSQLEELLTRRSQAKS